jgi:hypothetical protein
MQILITNAENIGRKCVFEHGGKIHVGTVRGLNMGAPRYSYAVAWNAQDNPDDTFTPGTAGNVTVINCRALLEII